MAQKGEQLKVHGLSGPKKSSTAKDISKKQSGASFAGHAV